MNLLDTKKMHSIAQCKAGCHKPPASLAVISQGGHCLLTTYYEWEAPLLE